MSERYNDALPMWCVYRRPSDYPNQYVARLFYVRAGTSSATPVVVRGATLEAVRKQLTPGLTRLDRQPSDQPHIVETWL